MAGKQGMQTIGEVVDRFTREGYRDQFRSEEAGLRAIEAGCLNAPEELHVDGLERFEGTSDPAEEAIVVALVCVHGVRGTWTVTYGPQMEPSEAEMVAHLAD